MTTSVHVPSRHENFHACAVKVFGPYPLHKFRRTLSFSYWCIWYISVPTLYHILSADYVWIWRFSFRLFSVCIYAGFNSFFFGSDLNHISNNNWCFLNVEGCYTNINATLIINFSPLYTILEGTCCVVILQQYCRRLL